MANNDKNDLGYLGQDFQYKLIHTFMEDKTFFRDIHSVVDQNMFTDPNLKTFVGVMKEYYDTKEAVPSYTMMEIALNEKAHNDTQREIYQSTVKAILETPSDGVEYIRELAERFFRQQNIIKTANEILKIAGNGDTTKYERCVDLLNEALNKGTHDEMGATVMDDIGETLSDDYRTPIPTGIGKIDETLEGGLGKGELGVIIGPTSFGKTSMTTAMASYAATFKCQQNNFKGYKVLQVVFEDRIKQIQRKHIGRITGVEAKDLSKEENKDLVKDQLDKYEDKELLQENLRIVRFPSGEVTPSYLKRFLKKLINNGFKPDMAVFDYFECFASETVSNNEFSDEGRTMRRFEAMAGEFDIAIWVPSQGTKDSINAELVTMDKMGGSVKKAQIAHVIMSIARTVEDIERNLATIAILKNRAGKSGKVFNNVEFNNGTCRISTDNVDEFESMVKFNENKTKESLDLQKMIFKSTKKSF